MDQTTSNPKGETMDQTTTSIPKTSDFVKLNSETWFIKLPTMLSGKPLAYYESIGAIYMKSRKGTYLYGYDNLARLLGLSGDTVKRHMEELEREGYIKRKRVTLSGTIEWEVDTRKLEADFFPNGSFYPLPIGVISDLRPSTKRHSAETYVFAFLMRRWNPKKWDEYKITPDSSEFIASKLCLSPKTVKQTLTKLKEKGYLMKITKHIAKVETIRNLKNDIFENQSKVTDLYFKVGADSEDDFLIVDDVCNCDDDLEPESIDICEEIREMKAMLQDMLDKLSRIERGIKRQWLVPTGKSKRFFRQ
jgi:DNA-binding Lrp family transcriptional regulator